MHDFALQIDWREVFFAPSSYAESPFPYFSHVDFTGDVMDSGQRNDAKHHEEVEAFPPQNPDELLWRKWNAQNDSRQRD